VLTALGIGLGLGLDLDVMLAAITEFAGVPGRMERVDGGQKFAVLVDYAHTPDSIANVLRTARSITTGRLIALIGCGGDRDKGKRPKMGREAELGADIVIVTSDNPRSEDPQAIIADTLALSLFNLKILRREDFYVEQPDSDGEFYQTQEERIADVTMDPIGRISGTADDAECFDLPDQRMEEEGVQPAARPTAKYPVKLHPPAFQRVLEAFEKKLTTTFFYPPAERQLTYADALIFQAAHCRKVIEGEAAVYQPVLLK
jgi:hypothetical protein